MEILITGGNGLLGHHLVPALQERGDDVRVLALPSEDTTWLQKRDVAVHRGDITFRDTLVAPMRGVDAVLHLAGMMGVWRPLADYRAVNVTGTENVCFAALSAGVRRLVHVSSWTVYGMALGQPAREDFPFDPFKEPYALTKAEGDTVVQRMIAEHHLPAVIVRPGTFFGPGDRLHFGRIADRLAADKAVVVGSGENALPLVYVSDVVQGLLLGLDRENAIGEAYNITNDRPLSQLQLLRAIARAIGAGPPRVFLPYRPLYAGAFAAERLAALARLSGPPVVTRLGVKLFGTDNRHAIEKARDSLGYCPRVPLEEGVRLTAGWYLNSSGHQVAEPVGELLVEPDIAGVAQS